MCSDPGQDLIQQDIHDGRINRVIVASCSPLMHEPTFRRTMTKAGGNPFLFQMANIREHVSWVTLDNDAATETTLLKLLAAVQKQGGAGGGGGGAGGSAKEAQQNLMSLAQQTGKTEKELENFEESVEEAGNALTRGFRTKISQAASCRTRRPAW